jgi:uncharacterized protein (TIGR03067 family)/prepilin-type processing-associated H-X9-DG protein
MSPIRTRGTLASLLALPFLAAGLGLLAGPGQSAQDKKTGKNPLDGTWTAVAIASGGKKQPEDQVKRLQMTFQGDKVTVKLLRKATAGTIERNDAREPRQFELKLQGAPPSVGIYRLEKDTLTLYFAEGGERPARFDAPPGPKQVLMVLKRNPEPGPATAANKPTKPEPPAASAAARAQSQNNLKQLALAMHNYHDVYKGLPTDAIYSKDGKPLLSWRVAVLPFVEQAELYQQFKLDEPWDSPNNKKLLEMMPALYAPVNDVKTPPHSTYYQVFTGPGTVFEGNKKLRFQDVTDGTSNTIMIVEAGEAVPWTKPQDLPYSPKKDLPKLGGLFAEGFNVAMCDGSVRWLPRRFNRAAVRLAITRSDGQPLDPNMLDR